MKTIKEIIESNGTTQTELARRFGIPLRTVQNWYGGIRQAPDYVLKMIEKIIELEKTEK